MIVAKINGPKAYVQASGDVIELAAEVASMVQGMYQTIENEKVKAGFKDAVQRMLDDGSPAWKPVRASKTGRMTAVYMEADREERQG